MQTEPIQSDSAEEIWNGGVARDDAALLAPRLQAALASGRPMVIDLAGAGEPSAAFVQLLLSAARAGDAFVLRRPSRSFVDGCSALGLFAAMMSMPMEPT